MSEYYDYLMSLDFMQKAVREGGAIVIARCIAVREDPEATPSELDSADLFEATMRERHGDPKPGWLAKEVEKQKLKRAEYKAFMRPFEITFEGMYSRNGISLVTLAALGHCMNESGIRRPRKRQR
jgi:hypothetical protein